MTKVPPSKVPIASGLAGPNRARRPRASEPAQKAKPVKAAQKAPEAQEAESGGGSATEGLSESGLVGHEEVARQLEKHAESWMPDTHVDREEKRERDEEAARQERSEQKDTPRRPGEKQGQGAMEKRPQNATLLAKRALADGFERRTEPLKQVHQAQPTSAAAAVKELAAALPPPPSVLNPGKPPDAMTLLHSAQDAGVFFKEDSQREGHSEDRDDPELAAAVEEAIRLLFGVRGILRVGPGRNQEGEPVVVIVANRGFGEAAMKVLPKQVHRFPTLLALPYELLPLRRER